MELKILNASLNRSNFEVIDKVINVNAFSQKFGVVYGGIREYYARDTTAEKIDADLLVEQLGANLLNDKHKKAFASIVKDAVAQDTSATNVADLLVEMRRYELRTSLSVALINDQKNVGELMQNYIDLQNLRPGDKEESDIEVFEGIDVQDLLDNGLNKDNLIRLYPIALNEAVGGGVPPETHIVVFGRPESGKSAEAITLACGFASQGLRGVYVGNEDPSVAIKKRFLTCITGWTEQQIRDNPAGAQELANENGLQNIVFAALAPGTLNDLSRLVKKHEAKWLVVDQARNIQTGKPENRVIQLEQVATGIREICKKEKVVGVSVTQAGDSAENKLVLEMGDVDFSNTGIPAQADLMIGVGVTLEYEGRMERCFSLPKNKINGNHEPIIVKLNPYTSRVSSL